MPNNLPPVHGEPLTAREIEVMEALNRGLSYKLIGDELDVSASTVKYHLQRCFRKLGATNNVHAAVLFERSKTVATA